MKVLLCHNYYQWPGGEDQSFGDEARLLEANGHEVVQFTRHNDAIKQLSLWNVSRRTLWNRQAYRELRALIRRERPAVMHCTNTFPLISPAACYAAQHEGVPVVHALRNYRLLCLNGFLLRDGKACEDCIGRGLAWPGVLHGCYRESRSASAVVAAMLGLHRAMKTWNTAIDAYFTLTKFARQKFIEGGLPAERIAVIPNFVHPDPGPGRGDGGYAVFVGRLAAEKGIHTLLAAWRELKVEVPLKILGDGPLAGIVGEAAWQDPSIQLLGHRPWEEVLEVIGRAVCLVMPSVWYETFGRTIMEAFAKGTPVIASGHGAMAELVEHGTTGLLFAPGNGGELASRVRELLATGEGPLARLRQQTREEYEAKYTAERNYELLISMYQRVVGRRPRLQQLETA